jgi:hypothetical protein
MGPGSRPNSSPEFSDADDEDDENQPRVEAEQNDDDTREANNAAPSTVPSDHGTDVIVSSIEGVEGNVPGLKPTSIPVIPSSQDSASSQSGSDSQNQIATVETDAKAVLHQHEVATGIQVSQKHRGAIISQSLALGGRDALESFRQACSYWRQDYAAHTSHGIAQGSLATERHPALERFSRAYYTATDTTLRRAVLDILHRINLAYLYEVYLETLKALSRFSLQQNASGSNTSCRVRDVFDEDVRDIAKDQMFWACYPVHAGKPRHGIDKTFRATLANAEKWHMLREEFNIGMLAAVPQGANNWFEKLPLTYLPVYFYLIRSLNPAAVSMGEMISDRVSASWKGEAPPKQLLRLEHLETIDEIPLQANPLKLLEEINVGCITDGSSGLGKSQAGRAVTIPADMDENNTAVIDAVFSSGVRPSQGGDKYPLSSGFYNSIDFSQGL